MYIVNTQFSAQDVLRTRHDKLPPMYKKFKVTSVKVLGMVRRG
jgi:hypothetical protein